LIPIGSENDQPPEDFSKHESKGSPNNESVDEVEQLKTRKTELQEVRTEIETISTTSTQTAKGKAPPVKLFAEEDLTSTLDDWLPSLHTAAAWYSWIVE